MFVRNFCCAIFLGAFALTVFADNQSFENNVEKKSNGDIIIKGIPEDCATKDKQLVLWGLLNYYKCDVVQDELRKKSEIALKENKGWWVLVIPKVNEFLDLPYTLYTIYKPKFNEMKKTLEEGHIIMGRFNGGCDWDFIAERTKARENYKTKIAEWKNILKKNEIEFKKVKGYDFLYAYLYGYNNKTKEIFFYLNGKHCALTDKEMKEHLEHIYYMDGNEKKSKGKRKLKL